MEKTTIVLEEIGHFSYFIADVATHITRMHIL